MAQSPMENAVLIFLLFTGFFPTSFCCGKQDVEQTITDEGFRLALPGYSYEFPKDHASHPEFKTEWWYFTGHLSGELETKPSFGYELTFFRSALSSTNQVPDSAWGIRDIYFAHFAITDLKHQKFWSSEKISRGSLGLAGATKDSVHVWIEKWFLRESTPKKWQLSAVEKNHGLNLTLQSLKPEVIHGVNGVSQKGSEAGQASHYVSLTHLETEGSITVSGKSFHVKGLSWFDHEFGSNQLSKDQVGWDWFSLQFNSGEELMIYLLRKENGCFEATSSGTWIDAKGTASHLGLSDISVISKSTWTSPRTRAVYPSRWEIRVPQHGLNVVVEPSLLDQELVNDQTGRMAYWEGACVVSGSHSGNAYVELTGYDHPLNSTPLSGSSAQPSK